VQRSGHSSVIAIRLNCSVHHIQQ